MTGSELETFLSILTVYFIVIAVPGPNTLVVARYALGGVWKAAFVAATGIGVGATINASITMFGAAALVVRFPIVMVLVAVVGGGVLIWLGLQCLQSALETRRSARLAAQTAGPGGPVFEVETLGAAERDDLQKLYSGAFFKGMWVNVSNPKGIAFFLVLYAPLISGASMTLKLSVLGTCFLLELFWFGSLISVLSLGGVQRFFARNSVLFDLVMATVLILLGANIFSDLPSYLARAGG